MTHKKDTRDNALFLPFRAALSTMNSVVGLETLMYRLMRRLISTEHANSVGMKINLIATHFLMHLSSFPSADFFFFDSSRTPAPVWTCSGKCLLHNCQACG
jgi:hypothetical protein